MGRPGRALPAWLLESGLKHFLWQWKLVVSMMSMIACAMLGSWLITPPAVFAKEGIQVDRAHRHLSGRTIAAAMILLLIPLTLYAGHFYFGNRKYYFISLLIVVETMLPFFSSLRSGGPRPGSW
jgi:hypothetical protein|nr:MULTISPECIES: hypothetical protein [unclassified Pseudoflavonifractor]